MQVYVTEINLLLHNQHEAHLDVIYMEGRSGLFNGVDRVAKSSKKRFVVLDSVGLTCFKSTSKTKVKCYMPVNNEDDILCYLAPEKYHNQEYQKTYKENSIAIYNASVDKTIILTCRDGRNFEMWSNALKVRMFSERMKCILLS